MSDIEQRRVSANGVVFNVESGGSGAPLLFINGSGSSIEGSRPLLGPLRRMAHVIAFDHRGMGLSTAPDGPWTMADYAADVASLLDALEVERCDVLGISFGGMVAQEFAVSHGERVRRLALWSTSAGGAAGSSYPLHTLAQLTGEERDAQQLRLLDGRFDRAWLDANPKDRALAESRGPEIAASREQIRAAMLQLNARADHDVAGRLSNLHVPVFVGAGRFDVIAPPANAEAIVALVVNARLRLYEGGHLFFFQDRRAFADLELFLRDELE